jgi:hypothetical protein
VIEIDKILIQVLLKDEEENYCAKCCKTRNVVERLIEEVPTIRNKTRVIYENISSNEIIEKYGRLTPPVIIIDDKIYSEGHVPILKKLAISLIALLDKQNN